MTLSSTLNRPLLLAGLGFTAVGVAALAAACAKGTPGDSNFTTLPDGATVTSDGAVVQPMFGDSGGFHATGSGCSSGMCNDFPADPIIDMPDGGGASVPTSAAKSFGAAGSGASSGGPCVYEPASGALFPNNWLRPRFYWSGGGGEQVYELRLSSMHESNDLVVYTTQTKWTMPAALWTTLANDLPGEPVTVTVRQLDSSGKPQLGTPSSFTIAPAPAQGGMVFWATNSFVTNSNSTILQGFQVGDETTATVLTPTQVQQTVLAGPGDGGNLTNTPVPVVCIGCHTSTPDGNYVGFTAQWPWPNVIASVQADAGPGSSPAWLSQGAIANLSPNNALNYAGGAHIQEPTGTSQGNNVDNIELGIETFSKAHFATGDHVEVVEVGSSADNPNNSAGQPEGIQAACQTSPTAECVVSQLVWVDLEWNGGGLDAGLRPTAFPGATSNGGWGILARTGDSRSAGAPSWSHDGTTIAYTSSDKGTQDGHMRTIPGTSPNANVMTIPYSANAGGPGGAGGAATAVQGASDPSFNEYYPAFSPDDKLLAFNRVGVTDDMYFDPKAEVYVVPASGGTAQRLAANDPAQCVGIASPGAQNSWPKWAPAPAGGVVPASDGKLYYWVTFSSTRVKDTNNPASGAGSPKAQLYIAGVSVDPANNNAITTYPAVYLWNQDPTYNNLIPAWDNFTIPKAVNGPPR